jgi:hypothetical protein
MDIKSRTETPIVDITKNRLVYHSKLYHLPLLKEYILDFVSHYYRSNRTLN